MAGGVKRNCLLARLCGCCCCGKDPCSEWQEATALSVRGRQVVTTHGTYTVRAGNQPVPGQTVLHNDCGHTAGARPQYRPSTLPKPQQGPLMVAETSYDTPQRPSPYHFPSVLSGGVFAGDGGGNGQWEPTLVQDDGTVIPLPGPFVADLNARTVSMIYPQHGGNSYNAPLLVPHNLITGQSGEVFWKQYQDSDGKPYGTAYGTVTTPWAGKEYSFNPAIAPRDLTWTTTATASGSYVKLIGDYVNHTGYIAIAGTLYAKYQENGVEKRYPIVPEGTYPYGGTEGKYLVDLRGEAPMPQPDKDTPTWNGPGGGLRFTQGWTTDPALLDKKTSLAGVAGGTWAALCGPMTRNEDGTYSVEHWILREDGAEGGLITRFSLNGSLAVISRTQFETEVLRVPAGSFQRFSSLGSLSNTWPTQWAFAVCKDAVRAVCLHDPWRDSVPGKRPTGSNDPEWWYWPNRPKKRPKVMPQNAPKAPLGLTLADVYQIHIGGPGGPT